MKSFYFRDGGQGQTTCTSLSDILQVKLMFWDCFQPDSMFGVGVGQQEIAYMALLKSFLGREPALTLSGKILSGVHFHIQFH